MLFQTQKEVSTKLMSSPFFQFRVRYSTPVFSKNLKRLA